MTTLAHFAASALMKSPNSAGVPREIVTRLSTELTKIMQSPDMRERLAGMGIEPLTSTPGEFGDFIKAEAAKWAKVVKAAGARAE